MSSKGIPTVLKSLREKAGLTQTELAERLGVYQSMVARWELGKGEPGISMAKPLAEALGVTVETLTGSPSAKPRPKKK
jgi:transcriptional regulator with XRE-family HTH domain